MKEFEIGKRYMMPSDRIATLQNVTKFGYVFKYGDGDLVGLTKANLRYVVEAAPESA